MADDLVRLGMALLAIALISAMAYQFGRPAGAVEPNLSAIAYPQASR